MGDLRLVGRAVSSLLLIALFAFCTDRGMAQMGQQAPAQQQPAGGTVVASPGSTVVTQPAQSGSLGGLIVAAPGSTVVAQMPAPSAGTKSATKTPTNTFSSTDKLNVVNRLLTCALDKDDNYKNRVLARAGAIDALGYVSGDKTVMDEIVKGLSDVLDREYITGGKYRNDASEFICFHVVQALGSMGWGAKASISQLQLLRGQNVILDAAIDKAVSDIKNGPQPQDPPAAPMMNPPATADAPMPKGAMPPGGGQ
jgi:hypothetical protein